MWGNVVQDGSLQLTSSPNGKNAHLKMKTASIKQYVHQLKTWAASINSNSTLSSFTVILKPFCLQCFWHTGPSRMLFSCVLPVSCQRVLPTVFPLVFLIPTHESFKTLKLRLQSWNKVQELQGSSCTVSTTWVFICKGIGTATGLKHFDQSQINCWVRQWSQSKPFSCQGITWA